MDTKKKLTFLLVAAVATVFTVAGFVIVRKNFFGSDALIVVGGVLMAIGVVAGLVANIATGAIVTSCKLIVFLIKKVWQVILNFPIAMSCLLWLLAIICVVALIAFGVLYALAGIALVPIVPALIRLIADKLYID